MRLTRTQHQSALGFNMTSMIDIVFLLIIFFMAVSQISKNYQRQVELPIVLRGGQKVESEFTINIDSAQKMRIGAQEVRIDEVVDKIEKEIERRGISADRMIVRVRLDKHQDSSRLNELGIHLGQIGVTELQYSVVQQK